MVEGPLVNLDKLSEPITKLVEVVSAGVGALYEPIGVVRRAKAQAKAAIIRAQSSADVASLEMRVASRLEHREAMRQENIEKVAAIAATELPPEVSEKKVDLDWTMQFLDHAQDVSDAELQTLWGRILAGEVANPGSYAKRTLGFLRTLDKWEAEAFTAFCSCALRDGNGWRVLFHSDAYYQFVRAKFRDHGIENHFAGIGLLLPDTAMPNPSDMNGKQFEYFGANYIVVGPPKPDASGGIASLELGPSIRYFSRIGQELATIAGAGPIDGYIERLSDFLNKESELRFERVT